MNAITKKLTIAIVALVMAVALATGTTFAWFTVGNTASLEGVDAEIMSGTDGLYISVDGGTTYSNTITKEALYLAVNKTKVPASTENTKFDGLVLKSLEYETSQLEELGATTAATANVDYLTFTIKFRATDKAYNIYLDNTSTVTSGTFTALNKIYAHKEITANEYATNMAAIAAGAEIPQARGANAVRIQLGTKFWNPNADNGYNIGNLALDYYNATIGTNLSVPTNYAPNTSIATVPAGNGTDATVVPANVLLALTKGAGSAYYTGDLVVKVWIDGWDGDCFNSILSDKFTTVLSFVAYA